VNRLRHAFSALILVQALHAVEKYYGRLWELLPPVRFICNLVAHDPVPGFLLLNSLFLLFGLWCRLWPVGRQWRWWRIWLWLWIVIEIINGLAHIGLALWHGGYFPGLYTAPLLLLIAGWLVFQLGSRPS